MIVVLAFVPFQRRAWANSVFGLAALSFWGGRARGFYGRPVGRCAVLVLDEVLGCFGCFRGRSGRASMHSYTLALWWVCRPVNLPFAWDVSF